MKQTRLVKFIYTIYLQKSTLHASLAGSVHFSAAYNMSQSGLRTGSSLEEEQPIYSQFDSKGWVVGLRDYVTSMKDQYPAEDHPSEAWLSQSLKMISLDQGRMVTSAPKQGTSGVSGQKSGTASAASSQLSAMQRNLAVTSAGVANLELSSKLAHQTQQLKDKTFRVHAFRNKAA